jgi:transcriptional regulator with XRE-family HTH domain
MPNTKKKGLLAMAVPVEPEEREQRVKTAAFIEQVLEQLGITQVELARRAGVETTHIGFMRKGLRGMGLEAARKLAHALGLPDWYVLRECGLIDAVPEDEDTFEQSPLKASLLREITDEQDERKLMRLKRAWEMVEAWDENGEGGDVATLDAPAATRGKKNEILSKLPVAG